MSDDLSVICSLSMALNVVLVWFLFRAGERNISLINDCFYFMGEITKLRQKIKDR